MLRSKATAALMRLKEIDRKYNIKHNEGKRSQSNVSTESSLEDSIKIVTQEETKPQVSPKSKVEVRIPAKLTSGDESSISDSTQMKELIKSDASKSRTSLENRPHSQPMLSQRSEISELISEAAPSVMESSSSRKNETTLAEDSVLASSEKTTIEEAIKTSEDRSKIISDASAAMDKDASVENVSFGKDQRTLYEDDTFEDVSTSSESSSIALGRLRKTSEEDTIISGVKKIKITPHRRAESVQKIEINEDRDKEIVELVAPKLLQSTSECDVGLDEELSNYVRTTENIDEAIPISLLKPCRMTPRKHSRRNRRHRRSSNETTEMAHSVASDGEKSKVQKENNTEEDVPARDGSSTLGNGSEQQGEESKAESVPETDDKSAKGEVENAETFSSEEKLIREVPRKSDVTTTLRNLNKDAINAIVRRHRVQTSGEVSNKFRHGRNVEAVVKLPSADASRNAEGRDCGASSSENVGTAKNLCSHQRIKEKKMKTKKSSRSSKSRKMPNYSKVEGKQSRFECRQVHRLRKYAAAMRLEQERQDIRNYLLDLERTRLEFGPGASVASSQSPAFKPLEFPKIASFFKPGTDLDESVSKDKDEVAGLQDKLLTIRQWLKDQYILYRDYSNLAKTVNTKYIPASLEDAKKTIRQLQKATIKSR